MTTESALRRCGENLCDKCLALQRREPDTLTCDFCARCRPKLLRDFSAMVEARLGDDPGEEVDA
jgi:hypothetical protein